jgi:hypothetical protein
MKEVQRLLLSYVGGDHTNVNRYLLCAFRMVYSDLIRIACAFKLSCMKGWWQVKLATHQSTSGSGV